MSLNIRLKHSASANKQPQVTDLTPGELALNINNASLAGYALNDAGAVQQMFGKATETQEGQAEIATQGEVDAGTDDERIITPAKLGQRLTDYTTNTVDAAIAVEAAARTAADALRVLKAGDTMTGPLTVSNDLTVSGAINHPTVAIAYGTVSNRGVLSNSYNIKNVNLIGGGNPSGYDIYFDTPRLDSNYVVLATLATSRSDTNPAVLVTCNSRANNKFTITVRRLVPSGQYVVLGVGDLVATSFVVFAPN